MRAHTFLPVLLLGVSLLSTPTESNECNWFKKLFSFFFNCEERGNNQPNFREAYNRHMEIFMSTAPVGDEENGCPVGQTTYQCRFDRDGWEIYNSCRYVSWDEGCRDCDCINYGQRTEGLSCTPCCKLPGKSGLVQCIRPAPTAQPPLQSEGNRPASWWLSYPPQFCLSRIFGPIKYPSVQVYFFDIAMVQICITLDAVPGPVLLYQQFSSIWQ